MFIKLCFILLKDCFFSSFTFTLDEQMMNSTYDYVYYPNIDVAHYLKPYRVCFALNQASVYL